jgi:potassium-transporting ATPase KdpC subunit
MIRETVHALAACVVTFALCAVAYPALVWGLGQLAFPSQAEGSLIYDHDRTVIGSELIAQPFTSDQYFYSRPSAVDYKADATGGSNLGTKNPDLKKKVAERAEALKASRENPAPVDLVTASGGGMDPHISPEGALYPAARVAAARTMPVGQVRTLIDRFTERSGAIIGAPPRVNVLMLNLALNDEKPAPQAATTPGVAEEVAAIRSRIGEIAGQVERLGKQLDAAYRNQTGDDQTRAGVKALNDRLAGIAEDTRQVPRLSERVNGLIGRLNAADESVRQVRAELQKARAAIRSLASKPGTR